MRKTQAWTDAEVEILRARYLVDGPTILHKELGRTKQSVQRKAWHLGIANREKGQRTIVEIEQLRKLHAEGRNKLRQKSPEYHRQKRATVLKHKAEKRRQNREQGTCILCDNPVLKNSRQYCLTHWAILAGSKTCRRTTKAFGKLLIDKLEEQNYICPLTGDTLIPGLNCSVDHIVPKSRGGAIDDPDNIRWITVDANRAKGPMLDDEFLEFCKRVIAQHNPP